MRLEVIELFKLSTKRGFEYWLAKDDGQTDNDWMTQPITLPLAHARRVNII